MKNFFIAYSRHFILNLGQALQGIRFFYSHPDFDKVALRGSIKHFRYSVTKRLKLILNDLFFAIIPPHWHHSEYELISLHRFTFKTWFEAGYSPWKFVDESLERRTLSGEEDRRWDPRCK